ncbi:hypothetical protein MKZ38_001783 [Zalerion maritima]|uniref:GTP:AMP phosphotransferase, mitochondrial n=1 Tax=Zalerion maritima TaxID=339359 RepID=A0AAD5RZ04_9PEZI|nr:hypothetical protein MKZ38_001783 [Zalerion maritima]
MRLRRAARVILIGAPGVGKGTQSERLLQRFPQLSSISSGDLLRHNVKNRTPLGIKVESTMKSGGLVSDSLILRLITNELNQRGWLESRRSDTLTLATSSMTEPNIDPAAFRAAEDAFLHGPDLSSRAMTSAAKECPTASFLLDGFPRTAPQAERLESIIPINLVVSLKTPLEVIMERIAGRWVHGPSGRIYNTTFNAPRVRGKDDVTGELLTKRSDDNEEVYKARWQKFQETSEPLLEHYAQKGVLMEVEGMSSDEISPRLYEAFEKRFVH